MFAERTKKTGQSESAVVVPGSLVGCAAYLSSTKTRAVVKAAESCKLVSFGPHELEKLLVSVMQCILLAEKLLCVRLQIAAMIWHAQKVSLRLCYAAPEGQNLYLTQPHLRQDLQVDCSMLCVCQCSCLQLRYDCMHDCACNHWGLPSLCWAAIRRYLHL